MSGPASNELKLRAGSESYTSRVAAWVINVRVLAVVCHMGRRFASRVGLSGRLKITQPDKLETGLLSFVRLPTEANGALLFLAHSNEVAEVRVIRFLL